MVSPNTGHIHGDMNVMMWWMDLHVHVAIDDNVDCDANVLYQHYSRTCE